VYARFAALTRVVRAGQWWDYKLVPICSIFYATTYTQHVSVATIWSAAVALVLALAPCAAYVSLVNDVSDRADDRRSGKDNRMAGRPVWQMALMLAAPLCLAAFFAILWRDDVMLLVTYLCAWSAFTLYSVPPFRLKRRGILGVIADASGAHLFPSLVAALAAYRAAGKPVDWIWLGTVAAWAFGCGLRGILWHQLYDREVDRNAGVATFVQRYSSQAAVRLAAYVALPIELVALADLLWRTHSPWPALFLLLYAAFALLRWRMWDVAIVISEPRGSYGILGTEYYTLLFPLGILLSCALRYPVDWTVLIAHQLVFPAPAVAFINETWRLLRELAQSKK
jgi:1,4-dihydroxy-2-naphthoate octaprenyltransferase